MAVAIVLFEIAIRQLLFRACFPSLGSRGPERELRLAILALWTVR